MRNSKNLNKIISFFMILGLAWLSTACTAGGGNLGGIPGETFDSGNALNNDSLEIEENRGEATPERPATFTELEPVEMPRIDTIPEEKLPEGWIETIQEASKSKVLVAVPLEKQAPFVIYGVEREGDEPYEFNSIVKPCWDCLETEQD